MATIRVGVVQMCCRNNLEQNRNRILDLIADTSAKRCDLAVFPEGILCDPEATASISEFDRAVDAIKRKAKTCNINLVVGVSAAVINKSHNRALVVDRNGMEQLCYQKNTEVPRRISIDGIPCSVAICSDRWYIEHADLPCLTQGAKIMIDISGGHGGDDGRPDLRWVRYRCWAIRNSAFVLVSNPPHDDEPDYMGHPVWGGHSAILDPQGAFLARAHYEKDALLTATLNPDLATRENAEQRRNHPLFRPWWDMGKAVLKGEDVDVPAFAPLESPQAEIKIAAAQIACSRDMEENLRQIAGALETASAVGADVAVFPAQAVTGNTATADERQLTQALGTMQTHARRHGIYAIVGMPFVQDGCLFNSAVVIDRKGHVQTRYNQISARPDGPFAPGCSTQAMWFEIDGVHATVTVGDDLYWPELTELAAYRGMQLHVHLDYWHGASDDANLVRKHSTINHLMPAVCGVWINAADPSGISAPGAPAAGGSLLLRRVGGHGKPDPGGVEAYLPYHTSVVQTGGTDAQILYFTAVTGSKNGWQAWRNEVRKNKRAHKNWFDWISKGVQAIHAVRDP